MSALATLGGAFALTFLAELGDKTQLALVALSSRSPPRRVLAGAIAAFLLLTALAVTVGAALARYVPATALAVAAGLLFLVFAVLALRKGSDGEETSPRAGFLGAFLAIAVGEMGDKTQLTLAALASNQEPWAVGVGGFAALALSSLFAVLLGSRLGKWVRPQVLRYVTAGLFGVVGLFLLVRAAFS